jgi:hypothetical protein
MRLPSKYIHYTAGGFIACALGAGAGSSLLACYALGAKSWTIPAAMSVVVNTFLALMRFTRLKKIKKETRLLISIGMGILTGALLEYLNELSPAYQTLSEIMLFLYFPLLIGTIPGYLLTVFSSYPSIKLREDFPSTEKLR